MALILNIDTATEAGSVCFARDGFSLGAKMNTDPKGHASAIAPFIHEILEEHDIFMSQIQAVAISGGPGSYTGLRVAASTAKGLCYAWDIPLIAVNTLEMMANGMHSNGIGIGRDALQCVSTTTTTDTDIIFCPMIDARRMDVFTALYDRDLQILSEPCVATLDNDFLTEYEQQKVLVFGTGMAKARNLFSQRNNWQFCGFTCCANHLASLSETAFNKRQFQDLAYFEPFYLKSFYSRPVKKA